MVEHKLDGGNTGGAVRVGDTVRRRTGPWTPSVHALLRHLEWSGFAGASRVLGLDEYEREVLSFLPGHTVGTSRPWPAWVHSDDALVQVADWLRSYHAAVANFEPPVDAPWREGGRWRPGLIVGHNDAAPYNAAWDDAGRLRGFFDWDLAAPVSLEWDLAFTAFAWVPLHARHVVEAEGFAAFDQRPRRLRLFLQRYGWEVTPRPFFARSVPGCWPRRRGSSAPRAGETWPTSKCWRPVWPSPCARLRPSSPATVQTSRAHSPFRLRRPTGPVAGG